MKTGIDISIVTPSYQQADFIEQAMRSVIEQEGVRFEYAVVDGGSTDGSAEVIRRYEGSLAWWVSEPDRGQSDAIRKGWARASGRLLAWINSDDHYLPGAFARALAAFDADPSAAIIFGPCVFRDETTGATRILGDRPLDLAGLLTRRADIPQPSAFVSARAVRAVGGVDLGLSYAMDLDLWLRLLTVGRATYVGGPPLAVYRWHPAAKSSRAQEAQASEVVRILSRFYAGGVPAEARAVRRVAFAHAHLALALAALAARHPMRALVRILRAFFWHPVVAMGAVRHHAAALTARG